MNVFEKMKAVHPAMIQAVIDKCDAVVDEKTQAIALAALKKVPHLRDIVFNVVGVRYDGRLNELTTVRFRAFEALAHTTNGNRGAEVDPVYQGLVAASALREYVEGVQAL